MSTPWLVEAAALSKSFPLRQGFLAREKQIFAVRDVDFTVRRAEVVGVVGESGCGKSTLGRLLLRLLTPSAGQILFAGEDIAALSAKSLRALRPRMQMVFQDPFGSLDPRRRIGGQIADGIAATITGNERRDRVVDLLRQVGLDTHHADRLPHEFSGGQRQRIAIARALSTEPDFVVADEPVAALDVSVQAQVVNLLADLRRRLGLAIVFISHDLHVVRHLSDRLVVMYLGRIIEEGPAEAVFTDPRHPYTRALIEATPSLHAARRGEIAVLEGDLPSPSAPPSGCAFRTRCRAALPRCADEVPELVRDHTDHRAVACLRAGEI